MYQTLYRKYRSNNLNELIGQEHVVQTLMNAMEYNRLSHAYIFSGPRGTGKTSTARIIAKLVNKTAESMDDCPICQRISSGSSVDVIEIDAASHTGVDHMRQLTDQTQFLPIEATYKVFIIDEVHMLSTGAFNALLKTLEEPPPNILFLLATTELHKIPATIQSRAQTLHFKLIESKKIEVHIQNICKKEQVTIDDNALKRLIQQAKGGMRDALSLLDQLMSVCNDNHIKLSDLEMLLGTINDNDIRQFLAGCFSNDASMVQQLSRFLDDGAHIMQLYDDVLNYLKDHFLIQNDHEFNVSDDIISGWMLWFCEQLVYLKGVPYPSIVSQVSLHSKLSSSQQDSKKVRNAQDLKSNSNETSSKLPQPDIQKGPAQDKEVVEDHQSQLGDKMSKEALRQLLKPSLVKKNKPTPSKPVVLSDMNKSEMVATTGVSEAKIEARDLKKEKPVVKVIQSAPKVIPDESADIKKEGTDYDNIKSIWEKVVLQVDKAFKPLAPVLKGSSIVERNNTVCLVLNQMHRFFEHKLAEPKYKQWFLSQYNSLSKKQFTEWFVTSNIDDVYQLAIDKDKVNDKDTDTISTGANTKEDRVQSKTINQIIALFEGNVIN